MLEWKLLAWLSASALLTVWVSKMLRGLLTNLFTVGELLSHSLRLWERMKLKGLQKVCIPQGSAGFSAFIAAAVLAACEIFFPLSCCFSADFIGGNIGLGK